MHTLDQSGLGRIRSKLGMMSVVDEVTPESVKADLMDRVKYEGDQCLWETVWTLNSSHPEAPLPGKVEIARQATLNLLEEGRIELWSGTWPDGPAERLSDSDFARLLVEDAPWRDPERATVLVWVLAPGTGP